MQIIYHPLGLSLLEAINKSMTQDTKFLDIFNFIHDNKWKTDKDGNSLGFYTDDEYIELISEKFKLDKSESTDYYNSIISQL